jgi:hypothetical protein
MYKMIDGELERDTVRPVAYQAKLKDGWVVDRKKAEEPIPIKKPKKKTSHDNKN